MEPEAQITELLKTLGLTQYEAQVFLELFKRSPQIARTLGEYSKVPRGRIYEVLKTLNKKGLVIEKPSRGSSPNLYGITHFPEGLERLKEVKLEEILQEKEQLITNYNNLIPLMTMLERKSAEELELREKEEFFIIKGETALDYYIKKLLRNAKSSILTNFTAKLLLKYKSSFLELHERQIAQTFVLADTELELVKEIIRGQEAYVLNIKSLDNPFLSVLSEARPSMIIVDDEAAVILFLEAHPNGLFVRIPEVLNYQKHVLSIFMAGAKPTQIE